MSSVIDVYWSFRSPYSYLVTPDLLRLREEFDVTIKLRPVLPIALRAKATIFNARDKKRPRYIVMDARRRAEFLGLPFRWPSPDPVIQDRETYEVAKDQPLIWLLTGLGIEAERRGKGIDLAYAVAALLWSGARDWDQGDQLSGAVAEARLDLKDMETALREIDVPAEVEQNHQALEAAGHWGVPTMVFDGEPFFGHDRVDTLRWRLEQAGLRNQAH